MFQNRPSSGSAPVPRSGGPRLMADGGANADPLPTLPPPEEDPARILALSGTVVQRYHRDTILAIVDSLAPDTVLATRPESGIVVPTIGRAIDQPILQAGQGMQSDVTTACDGNIVIAATAGGDDTLSSKHVTTQLPATDQASHKDPAQSSTHRCVISDSISLLVDPYERDARIEGIEEYLEGVPEEWLASGTTHLSTALRVGFKTEFTSDYSGNTLTIVGVGDSTAKLGVGADGTDAAVAVVDVYSNGVVDTDEVDPEKFGLRGVDQVGNTRIETLRRAGFKTPQDLVDARKSKLADLKGIAGAIASNIRAAARAGVEKTPVPTGNDSLPYGDPVFIDIETDGLNPSTAWLIGVLDGDSEDGTYLAFREEYPGDDSHLEAFMTWLTENASERPVVAWNGNGFDFPVIEDQLRQHCPEYVEAWKDTYCFDALYWARDKNGGNAALPGRTNKLESVAKSLGWEPSSNGIDGATVAEMYVSWRGQVERAGDPATVPEPDWDRLEKYCEDDVRALATIYDSLGEVARRDPETSSPTGEDSTQGMLSDFN